MVRILIALISVSVIATALNVRMYSNKIAYSSEGSSVPLTRAKLVFDELSYHLKMAGYGQRDGRKAVEIRKGDISDTLIVRYKNVEILFYVNLDQGRGKGVLTKSIDGQLREIAAGIQHLRINPLTPKLISAEVTLNQNKSIGWDGIALRSFSTSLKIGFN